MFRKLFLPTLLISTLGLSACDSSSDDDDSDSGDTNNGNGSSEIVTQSGKVADGYLVGATVCLDLNQNKVCDAGEPSATSTAGGEYTFEATQAQLDQSPLLVEIIAGETIDEDSPDTPILNRYTLSAPAGRGDFISPLTTIVHSKVELDPTLTVAAAEAQLLTELDFASSDISLFDDYVFAQNDEGNSDALQAQFETLHNIARVAASSIASAIEDIEDAIDGDVVDLDLDDSFDEIVKILFTQLADDLSAIKDEIDGMDEFDIGAVLAEVDTSVDLGAIEGEVANAAYPINMLGKTVTSRIVSTECSDDSVVAGWTYTFGPTTMTMTGTDSFDGCTLGAITTESPINMLTLADDFDIPFNCENYPLCTMADFNKSLNSGGTTYVHEQGSNTIVYTDIGGGGNTIVETLEIKGIYNGGLKYTESDLAGSVIYEVFQGDSECGDGFVLETLSFNENNEYTLDHCLSEEDEIGSYTITDEGYIHISEGEYISRKSYNEELSAWVVCWADSIADAGQCPEEEYVYQFSDYFKALAFINSNGTTSSASGEGDESDLDIVGVWDVSTTFGDVTDEWYWVIRSDGSMTSYDYAGDEYDDEADCYWTDTGEWESHGGGEYSLVNEWGDEGALDIEDGLLFADGEFGYFEGIRSSRSESSFLPSC